MIAWDKTNAQEMALPDDILGNGDLEGALPRMINQTIHRRRLEPADQETVHHRPSTTTESFASVKLLTQSAVATEQTPRSLRGRIARMVIGHPGGTVIAAVSVMAITALEGITGVVAEIVIVTVVLRLGIMFLHCSQFSHEQCFPRLSPRHAWRDEITFSLVFCAAAYLLSWPLRPEVTALALALNFTLQSSVHFAGRKTAVKAGSKRCGYEDNRAIIIGTDIRAKLVVDTLLDHPELDMHPIGFLDNTRDGLWRYRDLPLLGRQDELERLVLGGHVDALFVTSESDPSAVSPRVLTIAQNMGVTVHFVPMAVVTPSATLEIARLNGFPTLVYRATRYRYSAMILKRIADVVGSCILILLSSPIMLAAAIAITGGSRGSVLFKQIRSGRNGRRFELYKFRTMTCDAEQRKASLQARNEMSGPVFKISDDPRVTRVGKILRKYSIDELPQLFNVLAGDMALVGPRPPLPSEVLGYKPWQRRKLSVRPGLTCLWQVNGRNSIDFEDWMRLDLQYIDTWSLALDMKILARTIPTVLKGSGV